MPSAPQREVPCECVPLPVHCGLAALQQLQHLIKPVHGSRRSTLLHRSITALPDPVDIAELHETNLLQQLPRVLVLARLPKRVAESRVISMPISLTSTVLGRLEGTQQVIDEGNKVAAWHVPVDLTDCLPEL